jgi:hypothetical protein
LPRETLLPPDMGEQAAELLLGHEANIGHGA